ncbi:MAG: hypothetical protein K0S39_4684 [Paenibacillus sp.]|jgi:uncharacterized SAM-dependent methyltransferase|nr:hypothetical protein [Paenibacillus sp.]
MYQNYQQNAFQNQLSSSNVNSQYRGLETKYQPVGFVQSQYNQNPGMSSQFQTSNQYSSFQAQSPQSYHTASYRGNQQGHDSYLRADSTQPSQSQFGMGFANQASSFNNIGTSFGSQQHSQQQQQQQNPQSFHTASYRGDQPGHDSYLRADSTQPAQSQYGIGASSFSSFNPAMSSTSQFGSSQSQAYNQFQNPQSYHTASYRGNQQGHDTYLRADSTQPAQSQFGSMNTSFNRYQF